MKKRILSLVLAILLISSSVTVFAHSGRLDSKGGHNKTADGTYHYHRGSDRTTEYSSPQSSSSSSGSSSSSRKSTTPTPAPVKTPKSVPIQENIPVTEIAPTPKIDTTPEITPIPKTDSAPTATPIPDVDDEVIKVRVNDELIEFDQPPIMLNNRVLVPIRNVVEKMDCTVQWNGITQTVHVNSSDSVFINRIPELSDGVSVYVNNELVIFDDQPPVNIEGRVLLPVKFVVEKLGYTVDWEATSQTVLINNIK